MEIITGLDFKFKNSSISLGKFDGIHRGHRFLLEKITGQTEYIPTVFTFELSPSISKIYTQKEKDWILGRLGIQMEK